MMNMANIPNPNSMAARFVLHTAGIRIIFMSTIGVSERVLRTDPARDQHGGGGEEPQYRGARPSPYRAIGEGQQPGDQPEPP